MDSSNKPVFSEMEIDAIGEILNISLGSSATSVSQLLEKQVNITTPKVRIMSPSEFEFETYEPAIGVEINYVSGLDGKNLMILKESDVKIIVGLLLQTDFSDTEFVMDEMSIGAICEVMNQMMGASSTALSQFLNRPINISPPNSFAIENSDQFKKKYFDSNSTIVAVYFNFLIGDLVNSEFIFLMNVDLAKELISNFGISGQDDLLDESNLLDEEPPVPQAQPVMQQEPPRAATPPPTAAMQQPHPTPQNNSQFVQKEAPVAHNSIKATKSFEPSINYNVSNATYQNFDAEEPVLTDDQSNNLNMIMSVPLQITVEIGRTSRKIKEILDFSPGSIIELSKQAGSQVDVFVNGQPIAKGDVIVVDDYYGVRITEVCSNSEIIKLL